MMLAGSVGMGVLIYLAAKYGIEIGKKGAKELSRLITQAADDTVDMIAQANQGVEDVLTGKKDVDQVTEELTSISRPIPSVVDKIWQAYRKEHPSATYEEFKEWALQQPELIQFIPESKRTPEQQAAIDVYDDTRSRVSSGVRDATWVKMEAQAASIAAAMVGASTAWWLYRHPDVAIAGVNAAKDIIVAGIDEISEVMDKFNVAGLIGLA